MAMGFWWGHIAGVRALMEERLRRAERERLVLQALQSRRRERGRRRSPQRGLLARLRGAAQVLVAYWRGVA